MTEPGAGGAMHDGGVVIGITQDNRRQTAGYSHSGCIQSGLARSEWEQRELISGYQHSRDREQALLQGNPDSWGPD